MGKLLVRSLYRLVLEEKKSASCWQLTSLIFLSRMTNDDNHLFCCDSYSHGEERIFSERFGTERLTENYTKKGTYHQLH